MTAVSLCMIVRNEADVLARAVGSMAGAFDELVVVDTGSGDATMDVARDLGARVRRWLGATGEDGGLRDFAAARNVAIDDANGDYWCWMDADEVASPGAATRLRAHADGRPAAPVVAVTRHPEARWLQPRLFARDGGHRWFGAVHEWVGTPHGYGAVDATVEFVHRPRPRGAAPLVRNLKILEDLVRAGRADARDYFYVAATLQGLGRFDAAVEAWRHAMTRPGMHPQTLQFARLYLARALRTVGDHAGAAEVASEAVRADRRFGEAFCLLGDLADELHDPLLAAACFNAALRSAPCPLGALFHEPACYGAYPAKRLDELAGAGP
jgi:tetratricopeptide (TPR) repeat protein